MRLPVPVLPQRLVVLGAWVWRIYLCCSFPEFIRLRLEEPGLVPRLLVAIDIGAEHLRPLAGEGLHQPARQQGSAHHGPLRLDLRLAHMEADADVTMETGELDQENFFEDID